MNIFVNAAVSHKVSYWCRQVSASSIIYDVQSFDDVIGRWYAVNNWRCTDFPTPIGLLKGI